jgi:thiol-disulfide isomerase/thioredoxin
MVQRAGENPNDAALETLYIRRHGSTAGYPRYLASVGDIDRKRRRTKVLAERIAEPEPAAAFTLASLAGATVSSTALRGRIVVINFWGTWCGPCVAEMPEFQKFHERYRDDPGVVVLTIDNDENIEDLRGWIKKHEYDFPVLLDDGYAGRVGIHGWPTTWFIDGAGRITFSKIGSSESLAEEFGWRVEDIRGERQGDGEGG